MTTAATPTATAATMTMTGALDAFASRASGTFFFLSLFLLFTNRLHVRNGNGIHDNTKASRGAAGTT